ncbi:MAG: HAMP domain-containing histidine kinase [Opitutaceae bacterium]|nr:HAMP domain-containing histidine kinase [Opitutaceae bacterium]
MTFDPSLYSLVVSIVSLAVGLVVFWAQPSRFTNQVFLLWALLTAAITGCLYGAEVANNARLLDGVGPKNWLRAMNALAVLSPWVLWLLKEAILTDDERIARIARPTLPILCLSLLFAGLCFTDWFYLPSEPFGEFKGGVAFAAVGLFFFAGHLSLVVRGAQQLRTVSGIRRVEIQFLVVSMGACLVLCGALALATNSSGITGFRRQIKFVVLAGFALTAWGVAVYRIFDVRQVLLSLGQRGAVTVGIGLVIVALRELFSGIVSEPIDLWLSVAVAVPLAPWLDRQSQAWLRLDGEKAMAEWRFAALTISRAETSPEKLAVAFETLLRERCHALSAALLFRRSDGHAGAAMIFPAVRPGHGELCRLGWATPESLKRRRGSEGRDDLAGFLGDHALGAVVAIPRGSPSPALLVAVGAKTNQWPYTYPEVQRLQEVGELMDNILTHARLTADAALQARTEHLAMMARGLAHDLKNLITPISSFIMHAEAKVTPASAEAEVHAAAKRSVRRMTDYVGESLFFASRLTPRLERAEIRPLLETVRELCGARAASRKIQLSLANDGPAALVADVVLLQRMLGNLVDNAVQASGPAQTVTLRCATAAPGRVRFEIADEGSGIAPENLAHIFEPYFTTKQYGDEARGFGLGLTICEKIARLHHGAIRVRSELGRGTVATVELPEVPPAPASGARGDAPA